MFPESPSKQLLWHEHREDYNNLQLKPKTERTPTTAIFYSYKLVAVLHFVKKFKEIYEIVLRVIVRTHRIIRVMET